VIGIVPVYKECLVVEHPRKVLDLSFVFEKVQTLCACS